MNKNKHHVTRASFLLSVCPWDKVWSTWDSKVPEKGHNSQTRLLNFVLFTRFICEFHRNLKILWRVLFRPQITWGRNHFNASVVKLNFSECYKIHSQESWRWRGKKKTYITQYWYYEVCYLGYCKIAVFDILPYSPQIYIYIYFKFTCYCINHLYIFLSLWLAQKAEFTMLFSHLKIINRLLHVSLLIPFIQNICHITGHLLITCFAIRYLSYQSCICCNLNNY